MGGQDRFQTGWTFEEIEEAATDAICRYIDAHTSDELAER